MTTTTSRKFWSKTWVTRATAFRWQQAGRAIGAHADVSSDKSKVATNGMSYEEAVEMFGQEEGYGKELVLFTFHGDREQWATMVK